jgi:hypothetical protein
VDDEFRYAWPVLIPIVAIGGPMLIAIVAIVMRARVRELEIRERIMMVERGMVPTPESDPAGFDRGLHSIERIQNRHAGPRFRSAGIIVMSIGFGLMVLLGFVGVPREGIGVGGFLAILGFGLFINGLFASQSSAPPPPRSGPSPSAGSGSASGGPFPPQS